jgi:hypothetical protein
MRRLPKIGVLLAMFLVALPSVADAQWPRYPTAGVPRLPNGQPDLNAPVPKTADGKPDLTGMWENLGWRELIAQIDRTPGAPFPTGGSPNGPRLFRDIGAGVEGGLPFQSWAKELIDKRNADNSKDNPDALCLPMGNMQFHTHPQPRRIVQTPGLILIIYEANYGLRTIFTDGRRSPDNDPQPWWYGYSVGRWEGDTLIVETSGFRDDGWLDIIGSPLTDKAKTIERFRRTNFGTLEIEITVDDPRAYTKPWTVKFNQRIIVDSEMIEFICSENQKFVEYLEGAEAKKEGR